MPWYYADAGRQAGPVSDADFESLVATGSIRPETLVWREGMASWQSLATTRGMPAAAPIPPPVAAVSPYAGFWIRFVARFIDGIIQNILISIIAVPLLIVFGFGAGFSAILSQNNPEQALAMIPAMVGLYGILFVVSHLIGIAYEAYFLTTRAATPGKMLFGLKVIRADGGPITLGLVIGRYFAAILSGMILLIGYIMAGFDSEKRALHDHICGTRVVKTR